MYSSPSYSGMHGRLRLLDNYNEALEKFVKERIIQWASCQMRKVEGYARAGNAGNVFLAAAG